MGKVKMKMIMASAAAAWAACTLAVDWTGNAGNYQLDDAANWGSTPKVTDFRVAVTADPQLLWRGGTYTLFRTSADNSCHSAVIDWIYDQPSSRSTSPCRKRLVSA